MTRSDEPVSKASSPFAVLENILFTKNIARFEAFGSIFNTAEKRSAMAYRFPFSLTEGAERVWADGQSRPANANAWLRDREVLDMGQLLSPPSKNLMKRDPTWEFS